MVVDLDKRSESDRSEMASVPVCQTGTATTHRLFVACSVRQCLVFCPESVSIGYVQARGYDRWRACGVRELVFHSGTYGLEEEHQIFTMKKCN